jgi:hypothetical protein
MGRAAVAAGCLALAALGLAAAGCGSSSPRAASAPATTARTTTGAGRRTAAFGAFQTCLKAHGVATPGFFGGPRGRLPGAGGPSRQRPAAPPPGTTPRPRDGFRPPTAKERAALAACRSKLPSGTFAGGRRLPGRGGPNGNPAFAKYTACLRRHGVTFGSTSSNPAAFRKAQAACAKLLPAAPGAPATTSSS